MRKLLLVLAFLPCSAGRADDAKVEACITGCEQLQKACEASRGEWLHEIACGVRSLKCLQACKQNK